MTEESEVKQEESVCVGEFVSSDIYLIAAMIVHGACLVYDKIDKADPRHVKLTVRGSKHQLKDIQEAWTSPANILKKYSIVVKDLKSIVHA